MRKVAGLRRQPAGPRPFRTARLGAGAGRTALVALTCALVVLVAAGDARAAGAPWSTTRDLGTSLQEAQIELVLGDRTRAQDAVRRARRGYSGSLRTGLRERAPGADRALRRALARAGAAARTGDETGWRRHAAVRAPHCCVAPTP